MKLILTWELVYALPLLVIVTHHESGWNAQLVFNDLFQSSHLLIGEFQWVTYDINYCELRVACLFSGYCTSCSSGYIHEYLHISHEQFHLELLLEFLPIQQILNLPLHFVNVKIKLSQMTKSLMWMFLFTLCQWAGKVWWN